MDVVTVLLVLMALCLVGMFFCLFMLVRNDWVYQARFRVAFEDRAAYERLPSYSAMMWRLWVWDIQKFLPPAKKGETNA